MIYTPNGVFPNETMVPIFSFLQSRQIGFGNVGFNMTPRMIQETEPIPGYKLVERLGRGGYGEVWKAEAPGGLFKAIKFVYGDLNASGEDSKGAEQELKALNRVKTIRHPYILSIERFDIVQGQLLIVMELADRNLWDRFKECREKGLPGIPREELLRYMDETCEALDLMNLQYQIQHLDIKPQNLFLIHNHVKVADFGLAKDFEGIRATMTGGVTPVYAPPETFEGWVSRHSDQYSLAIVFQELLTGVRPFSGTNTRQLLMQHVTSPPDLSSLPSTDREAVGRALSKIPSDRFETCMDFVSALRNGNSISTVPLGNTPIPVNPSLPPGSQTLLPGHRSRPSSPDSRSGSTPQPTGTESGSASGFRTGLKGLPALITPARQQSGKPSPSISESAPLTMQRPIMMTGKVSRMGIAGPEFHGNGVLFPAYFIAAGNIGLQAMLRLRSSLYERFGQKTLPHLKWLFLDTDSTTIDAALNAPKHQSLETTEVLPIRLQRPAHYLRRDHLPPLDAWLTTELLYRMPRDPMTSGIRAMGRLAFCDHYASISRRIREDIETFLTDDLLRDADQHTQLGIRHNRPRVFLLSSLFGGTGSGILLDLAYVVRQEMRQLGYLKPMLTGVFFGPTVDRHTPKSLPIANTRATLVELSHFSRGDQRYEVRFDNRLPPVVDLERPFERAIFLSLPKSEEHRLTKSTLEQAAALLLTECLTPLGKGMDDARKTSLDAKPSEGFAFQSSAVFRMVWPRSLILEHSLRLVMQTLLQRLLDKDGKRVRQRVETWIAQEWQRRQLVSLDVASRLAIEVESFLKARPETVFAELLQLPSEAESLDLQEAAFRGFNETLLILGQPGKDEDAVPGTLVNQLETLSRSIAADCEVRLAEMAVYFVEQPEFRFIGAEEAIRCLSDLLLAEQQQLERRSQEWKIELEVEFLRLLPLLGALPSGEAAKAISRRNNLYGELFEQLLSWSLKRYRYLLNETVSGIYLRLSGNIPEYLREINFCRHQLREVNALLPTVTGTLQTHSKPILPVGCATVTDAAELFIGEIPPADWLAFEELIQGQLRRQFRALLHVCLKIRENGQRFVEILTDLAKEFVETRVPNMSAAEAFFAFHTDTQSAQREILRASDETTPETFGARPGMASSFLVGVSNDPAGERFRKSAVDLIDSATFLPLPSGDDLVFLREYHTVPIAELPQVGTLASEAMVVLMEQEKTPAHSRGDVTWLPLSKN